MQHKRNKKGKMNKLATYIKEKGFKKEAFAKRLGIHRVMLGYLLNDRRKPSLEVAIKIDKETEGVVSFHDWDLTRKKPQKDQRGA